MNKRIPCLIALLALLTPPVLADAYKCRLPDGSIEIANAPCKGSATVSVQRDEVISPEKRRQAELEVERMRSQIEKREAEQRASQSREAEQQARTPAGAPPPSPASVEECLRELDRQVLDTAQRSQREAECRNRGYTQPGSPAPVYVPVPVTGGFGGFGGNPLGACIQNIEQLQLPPAEKSRRLRECESAYSQSPHPPRHPHPEPGTPPAPAKPVPAAAPSAPKTVLCPPGRPNCYR